jgi:hypothetical protein
MRTDDAIIQRDKVLTSANHWTWIILVIDAYVNWTVQHCNTTNPAMTLIVNAYIYIFRAKIEYNHRNLVFMNELSFTIKKETLYVVKFFLYSKRKFIHKNQVPMIVFYFGAKNIYTSLFLLRLFFLLCYWKKVKKWKNVKKVNKWKKTKTGTYIIQQTINTRSQNRLWFDDTTEILTTNTYIASGMRTHYRGVSVTVQRLGK